MIKNKSVFTSIVALVAILTAIIIIFPQTRSSKKAAKNPEVLGRQQNVKAVLAIDIDGKLNRYDISQNIGEPLLEATKIAVGGKIETKGDGQNVFITSIDGKQANPKKKEFWKFVINGKEAEFGAGSYVIRPGDSISWMIGMH